MRNEWLHARDRIKLARHICRDNEDAVAILAEIVNYIDAVAASARDVEDQLAVFAGKGRPSSFTGCRILSTQEVRQTPREAAWHSGLSTRCLVEAFCGAVLYRRVHGCARMLLHLAPSPPSPFYPSCH